MQICVYGASSAVLEDKYLEAGLRLGRAMGRRGHSLVFGGGDTGLMGAVARGVKAEGGRVTGVAPSFFRVDGVLYQDCDEMIHTNTMRERKQIMEELSDGFIMAPGGIGTMEEFMEILTLRQLGLHEKPIGVLNTCGFFDPLAEVMRRFEQEHFLKATVMDLYQVFEEPEPLLDALEHPTVGSTYVGDYKPIKL